MSEPATFIFANTTEDGWRYEVRVKDLTGGEATKVLESLGWHPDAYPLLRSARDNARAATKIVGREEK